MFHLKRLQQQVSKHSWYVTDSTPFIPQPADILKIIFMKEKAHIPHHPSSSLENPRDLTPPPTSLLPSLLGIERFQAATMRASTTTKPNHALSLALIYLLIFTTSYTLWRCLCAITHTSSPIVVVTSESMEPVFQHGDVLFVSNRASSIESGDIVVCWIEGWKLPFVHRVIEKHVPSAGTGKMRGMERRGFIVVFVFSLLRRDER